MTGPRLTAAELHLSDKEYEALLWVRDALDPTIPDTDLPDWMVFDMHTWRTTGAEAPLCGTHCCIGGSMSLYMTGMIDKPADYQLTVRQSLDVSQAFDDNTNSYTYTPGYKALEPLFFYYDNTKPNDRTTAVAAIDQFLSGNTGDPHRVRNFNL